MFRSTYCIWDLVNFVLNDKYDRNWKTCPFAVFHFSAACKQSTWHGKLDKEEAIFPLIALKRAVLNDFNIKVLNKDESWIGKTKLNQWFTAKKDVIIYQYTAFLATRHYLSPRLNWLEINYDLPNQKFSFSDEETYPFDLLCGVAISRTFRTEFHAMKSRTAHVFLCNHYFLV